MFVTLLSSCYLLSVPDIFLDAQLHMGIQLYHLLGLSNVDLCINFPSKSSHSCYSYCNTPPSSLRNCGCDAQCYMYNDCCPDYEIFCGDRDNYNYLDMFRHTIPKTIGNRTIHIDSFVTCHTPSLIPHDDSYYMVTKCPDDATNEEHQLCASETLGGRFLSLIPVYVTDSKGIYYYANKFCAACHGHVDESIMRFFTPKCEWVCNQNDSPYL